jgi:hypothetical protein
MGKVLTPSSIPPTCPRCLCRWDCQRTLVDESGVVPSRHHHHHGSPCSHITWGTNNRPVGGRSYETWSRPVIINRSLNQAIEWTSLRNVVNGSCDGTSWSRWWHFRPRTAITVEWLKRRKEHLILCCSQFLSGITYVGRIEIGKTLNTCLKLKCFSVLIMTTLISASVHSLLICNE